MKIFQAFLLLLCCAFITSTSAQYTTDYATTGRNQAVYLELGGSGLLYSINYDFRLNRGRQDGAGVRVGIGGLGVSASTSEGSASASYFAAPVMFNYLVGKRRHAFEVGAGVTLLNVNGEVDIEDEFARVNGFAPLPTVNVGYRFQSLENGFTGRFNLSPIVAGGTIVPWVGLSFGVNFK